MFTMVDTIVTSLVKNVSQLLVQESNLVLNARDQLLSLQDELKFINEFLKRHSQGKRGEVREEVKQIKDVALEAEDLLDDFVINMARYKRRNWPMRLLHVGEKTLLLRNVAVEIQRINKKLKKIHENKDKYNIANNDVEVPGRVAIQSRRRNVEEDEVVSFDNDAEQVMKMLDTQDPRRDVVSIVGMGGLGKTTLAKKIYNSSFVKQDFDFRAWVDVSQDFRRKELLLKIANSAFPYMDLTKFEEGELKEKLRSELEEKRYMIVLDDVWDKDLWNGIKAAFPDNGKRSWILLTTRLNEVASHASLHTPPYFLPLLNEKNSWKLFSTKVFHDQVCHPNLEQVARQQILPKCKGLPLAIVVVAGLLKNREESMWSKVASGLDWYLAQNPTECLGILALSYDDLPPHLKPCFLYFGVYPEDYLITSRRLIRLWVAEGFIDEGSNTNLDIEEMAEEYLLQLIDRSLIQVVKRRSDGGVKSCRIHDLLRDLCISKGEEENFFLISKAVGSSLPFNKPIRRLAVDYNREIRYAISELSRLRSLLTFCPRDKSTRKYNDDLFCVIPKLCLSLRVLDFNSDYSVRIENLVQLRYLKQLRYLRMNGFVGDKNVTSISNANLQTLDLKYSEWSTLGLNIWEMQQLRHLILSQRNSDVYIEKGNQNSALPNLRTLSNIVIRKEDGLNMLEKFPNLKKIKGSLFCGQVELFEYLNKLQFLQVMHIYGKFKFTNPGAPPLSLTKITLSFCDLDTSAFTKLGGLPNLQVLKLYGALKGSVLEYDSDQGRFPQLQVLYIRELDIDLWSMKGKGLQSLVYLTIVNCYSLKTIPDQLKQISTLRRLEVQDCEYLKESLKQVWVDDPRYIYTTSNP